MSTPSDVDVTAEDGGPPPLDEQSVGFDGSVATGGTGDGEDEGGPPPLFREEFDITVGQVVMEDKETFEQQVMWKAKADDESCVSDSITDAVMGCIEAVTGGEL